MSLSLWGKLILGFGLLIALLLIAVGLGYYAINEVNKASHTLSELQSYEEISQEVNTIITSIERIQNVLLLVGLVALIVGVVSALLLYRSILRPIRKLSRGCEMVEKGDLRQEFLLIWLPPVRNSLPPLRRFPKPQKRLLRLFPRWQRALPSRVLSWKLSIRRPRRYLKLPINSVKLLKGISI